MDDFMSILGKSSGPENLSQVAEARVFLEGPDGEKGTETEAEITPFPLSNCPLIRKPSGAGPPKTQKRKKPLLLRLTSLRFQPPFQKGLGNFHSGAVKRICLKCWKKSIKKLHLQGWWSSLENANKFFCTFFVGAIYWSLKGKISRKHSDYRGSLRACLKIKFDSIIGIRYYPIWSMCTWISEKINIGI